MAQTDLPGYRTLTKDQLKMMSHNKPLEEIVLRQIDKHVREHGSKEIDQRWVSVARTHIQEGFMALGRSIAQPERIRPQTSNIEGFAADVERLVDDLIRS